MKHFFLDFEIDENRKKMSDFRLTSRLFENKIWRPFPCVVYRAIVYIKGIHYRFSQIMLYHYNMETCAAIKFCVW